MDQIVAQIGRHRNPAENSLADAREYREIAEYHGRCLFESESGGSWTMLPDAARESWIDTAIAMLAEHAAIEWPPPDPPGGIVEIPPGVVDVA